MNNKLLLQDLADQLSESGKLKKKEAEEFLKAFFKVIEESLFQGEIVKIQGLGTFKLLRVESRKSVNVSTGEEFELKEHYKISYTPDLALKTLVNEPFSHLEPVELDVRPEQDRPFKQKIRSEEEDLSEPVIAVKSDRPDRTNINKQKSMSQSENDSKSPNRNSRNDIKQPVHGSRQGFDRKVENKNSVSGKLFWFFFVVIVIVLAIWAYISNEQAQKENVFKLKETALFDSTSYEDTKPEEFETVIEDSLKLEAEIASKIESLAMAEKSVKPVKKNLASASGKIVQSQLDTKPAKPEVKEPYTSNVNVSGFKFPVIETLRKGEMLTLMSLKYYGHKAFWVYIYAANANVISDPDHIPLGTKIRIPKPDPSIINAKDPNCVAKAKALQTKILSRK